eukprot:3486370-Alexandrium_andersonii.AAC.1
MPHAYVFVVSGAARSEHVGGVGPSTPEGDEVLPASHVHCGPRFGGEAPPMAELAEASFAGR